MRLSIIIPAYNEINFIDEVVDKVEGKKIVLRDGIKAFFTIVKYNLFRKRGMVEAKNYLCPAQVIPPQTTALQNLFLGISSSIV